MKQWTSWQVLITVAGLCVGTLLVSGRLLADPHGIVWLWPLTAVQSGLLIPLWPHRRLRAWALIGGLLGTALGDSLLGAPLWYAGALAFDTWLETALICAILCPGVCGFEDLKTRAHLKRLAIASLAAPGCAGLFSLACTVPLFGLPGLRFVPVAMLSDSLGIAVFLPLVLFLLSGKYRNPRKLAPYLPTAMLPILLLVAAAIAAFFQTSVPLLFLTFPPMVLLVMSLGLEGAMLGSLLLVGAASLAVAHAPGPAFYVLHRPMPLFQLYLWMGVATSMPVGALLDEYGSAQIKANDARAIYLTLLHNTSDMIILSSFDGKKRFITAACEQLSGFRPEEFSQLDRRSTCHPDDVVLLNTALTALRSGEDQQFRYRLRQKTIGYRWVEAFARAYSDPLTGQTCGYVATIRDIADLLGMEREREQLSARQRELDALARTDALTGLPNRRAFDHALDELTRRAHPGEPNEACSGSILMIDVDCFKAYNDLYGHQAGDETLRIVAEAIRSYHGGGALPHAEALAAAAVDGAGASPPVWMRPGDLAARWGGEEFAVLLPGAPAHVAVRIANAILASVQALGIEHGGSPHRLVTVSIGVATRRPEGEAAESWLERADQALYASKHEGRNRWTFASAAISLDLPRAPAADALEALNA